MSGNNIRKLREARGWSRRELVARIGCTQQWLYLLERGEIRMMPKHVSALCTAFGVTPAALTGAKPTAGEQIDIVAEAVISVAVAKSGKTGKTAQALRQQLRHAAQGAKASIRMERAA